MSVLQGKSVLLVAPEFYGYHHDLVLAFKKKGANVTFVSEMKESLLFRVFKKCSLKNQMRLEKQHLDKLIVISKSREYDIVLVIRGGYLTPNIMRALRSNLKSAKFFMYQWDSRLQRDYRDIVPFFDSVSTFDREDAKELGLRYVPLFYTNDYRQAARSANGKGCDLIFFGAYHSDRLAVIKYFSGLFRSKGLVFNSHLYIKKMSLLLRLLTGEIKIKDLKFFKTYSVPSSKVSQEYAKSIAVLDVELSIQSGLSIRTFEALASGLKLVTTNANITLEEFYKSEQIMVIDRNKLDANASFFSPADSVVDVSKYHIDAWLERLFSVGNESESVISS